MAELLSAYSYSGFAIGDGQSFGLDERIERKDSKRSVGRVRARGGS
jgi:hypothetical protein